MKIVIDNLEFPFNMGCQVLKLKHGDNAPFPQLKESWDAVPILTFSEIAQTFKNMEQRRIAIKYLGTERLVNEINPRLISKETITKTTTWIHSDGTEETITFDDTYELCEVDGKLLSKDLSGWGKLDTAYYVKFKDTSTKREYIIWVEPSNVYLTNNPDSWRDFIFNYVEKINAIQAIAWTIQTKVDEGNIEKIVRQGDCILIKQKSENNPSGRTRNLTEREYRELLVLES